MDASFRQQTLDKSPLDHCNSTSTTHVKRNPTKQPTRFKHTQSHGHQHPLPTKSLDYLSSRRRPPDPHVISERPTAGPLIQIEKSGKPKLPPSNAPLVSATGMSSRDRGRIPSNLFPLRKPDAKHTSTAAASFGNVARETKTSTPGTKVPHYTVSSKIGNARTAKIIPLTRKVASSISFRNSNREEQQKTTKKGLGPKSSSQPKQRSMISCPSPGNKVTLTTSSTTVIKKCNNMVKSTSSLSRIPCKGPPNKAVTTVSSSEDIRGRRQDKQVEKRLLGSKPSLKIPSMKLGAAAAEPRERIKEHNDSLTKKKTKTVDETKKSSFSKRPQMKTNQLHSRRNKVDDNHKISETLRCTRRKIIPPHEDRNGCIASTDTLSEEQLLPKESNTPSAKIPDKRGNERESFSDLLCSNQRVSDKILPSPPSEASKVLQSTSLKHRPCQQDYHRKIGESVEMVVSSVAASSVTSNCETTGEATALFPAARQFLATSPSSAEASVTVSKQQQNISSSHRISPACSQSPVVLFPAEVKESFFLSPSDCNSYQTVSPQKKNTPATPRPQQINGRFCNPLPQRVSIGRTSTSYNMFQRTPFLRLDSTIHFSSSFSRQDSHDHGHHRNFTRTPGSQRSNRRSADCGSITLTSAAIYRQIQRRAAQGSAMLLRGIRHRNHLTVLEALKALDADPNEYFNVPTSYLPWILSAPFQHPYGASSFPPLPCLPSHLRVHPLHLAVAVSTQAVVRTLLDWGACINALDSFNRNPLHIIIQPPPIDLPYEQGDKKRETFAELPSKLTDTSVEDTYRKLSHFLYKQAGKRTSNEVKIASLLCSRGVDLTRCDMWGRSCVDYATDWLRINRLMRLGRIRLSQLPPPDRLMSLSDINAQSDLSCPVPMRPQCNISSVVSIQISNRIPHEVIDVVLLYEDRLRLLAMSPVIGLDVGGNISPRRHIHFGEPSSRNQTSSHDVKQSAVVKGSIPLASPACTPIRSVTPQAFGTPVGSGVLQERPNHRPSLLERRGLHLFRTPSSNSVQSIISLRSPSPGVTQLTVRWMPRTLTSTGEIYSRDRSAKTSVQTALAQKCCSGTLKRSVPQQSSVTDTSEPLQRPLQRPPHPASEHNKDDFATFLYLVSSPKFRFHSAFLSVWEFLGADIFPLTEEVCRSKDDEPASVSLSPSQPEWRKGRLSLMSLHLDSESMKSRDDSLHLDSESIKRRNDRLFIECPLSWLLRKMKNTRFTLCL